MQITPIFRPLRLGLDCGAHRTRLVTPERGVVLDEPSVLAVEVQTDKVLATGAEAEKMAGRVNEEIVVQWPVKTGEVTDEPLARALLQMFLRQASVHWLLPSPAMMVTTAVMISPAARQSWIDVLYGLGAGSVHTIAEPLAASIGAGVPIADTSGSFLVQLGYDRTEAVVVSLGSIVDYVALPLGGSTVLDWLALELRECMQFSLSRERTAHLLHHIASLHPEEKRKLLVTGKDAETKRPRELEITSAQLHKPVLKYAQRVERAITELLSNIRPELTTDVIDKGFLLSGGLAQLSGLDAWLTDRLGVPVSVVEEPALAAIRGVQTTLENLEEFKNSLAYQSDE
ncbi:MAG: hypothetical protein GW946_01995 [Candidatus Pacebacteria bacterium]|nr:hypothetical protein [Candidatus Paceibacterota bacterium]PIR60205.1 MAG: hypothetical protein COU67_03005 [Candidatus Pacebacteria bacterium CG10_big_fil_rev_8_21_14_0_10_44_54]